MYQTYTNRWVWTYIKGENDTHLKDMSSKEKKELTIQGSSIWDNYLVQCESVNLANQTKDSKSFRRRTRSES